MSRNFESTARSSIPWAAPSRPDTPLPRPASESPRLWPTRCSEKEPGMGSSASALPELRRPRWYSNEPDLEHCLSGQRRQISKHQRRSVVGSAFGAGVVEPLGFAVELQDPARTQRVGPRSGAPTINSGAEFSSWPIKLRHLHAGRAVAARTDRGVRSSLAGETAAPPRSLHRSKRRGH